MATYNNYQIKPVSDEDSFLYEAKDKLFWLGSTHGFILGEFASLEDKVNQNRDVIPDLRNLYKSVESLLDQYMELNREVNKEWIKRGKPYSLKAQKAIKLKKDREDQIKEEFYDR